MSGIWTESLRCYAALSTMEETGSRISLRAGGRTGGGGGGGAVTVGTKTFCVFNVQGFRDNMWQ